jgi:F0F1-type ATP synthase assembly protein I
MVHGNQVCGGDMNTTTAHAIGTSVTNNRSRSNFSRKFGLAYSLAFEMAIAVIVPVLVGSWLDSHTGKGPWFTIGGAVLGGAAAMRSAYRTLMELQKKSDNDKKHPDENSKGGDN